MLFHYCLGVKVCRFYTMEFLEVFIYNIMKKGEEAGRIILKNAGLARKTLSCPECYGARSTAYITKKISLQTYI